MTRKTLVILTILFATLFIGSSVFASSTVGNATNDMGTEMSDSWNKLSGTVQNAGNNVRGAISTVGNTMSNMMNGDNNNDNNNTDNGNVNDATANNNTNNNTTDNNDDTTWFGINTDDAGYTATRTTGTTDNGGNLFGMNSTMWTWLILGITAIGIVTLVWYYGTERTDATHSRNK